MNNKILNLISSILMIMCLFGCNSNQVNVTNSDNQNYGINTSEDHLIKQPKQNLKRIINIDGIMYFDTGVIDTSKITCGTMDGTIVSTVKETEIPTENNQSNFGVNYSYQYGKENQIVVYINNERIIFEAEICDGVLLTQETFNGK